MIKQEKLFSMIAVVTLAGSLSPAHCAPPAPKLSWRKFVSSARIDYRKHEYKKAIAVYTDAIRMVENSSPTAESKYDLYLNLAEAYRLNNQLAEAEAALKNAEPVLSRGTWSDPLIQVRYWRRRASLYLTQGQFRKSGEASLKAIRILRQWLPGNGAKELIAAVITMNNAREWPMSAALINELRSYPMLDTRTKQLIAETIDGTSSQMRLHLANAIDGHDAKEAEQILVALTEIDANTNSLPELWIKFLSMPEVSEITPGVKARLDKLLAAFHKQKPAPNCWEHLLRGKILEQSHQLLEAEIEFEKACTLATKSGNEAEKSASYSALASAISSFEQLRAASIELLLEEQKLTSQQYEYLWKYAGLSRCHLHHVRVCLRLATEYARADKVAAAETALSGISPVMKKDLPLFDLKVLTPQLEICRALVRAGRHQDAEQLYSRLARNVAAQLGQPAPKQAPSVKPFLTRLAALNEQTRTELAARDQTGQTRKAQNASPLQTSPP